MILSKISTNKHLKKIKSETLFLQFLLLSLARILFSCLHVSCQENHYFFPKKSLIITLRFEINTILLSSQKRIALCKKVCLQFSVNLSLRAAKAMQFNVQISSSFFYHCNLLSPWLSSRLAKTWKCSLNSIMLIIFSILGTNKHVRDAAITTSNTLSIKVALFLTLTALTILPIVIYFSITSVHILFYLCIVHYY